MFYFKKDAPPDLRIDTDQLKKVQEFEKNLQAKALVQSFHGTSDFSSQLRIHLNKLVDILSQPDLTPPHLLASSIQPLPYEGFYDSFREVVAAKSQPQTGAILHVVFGNIAAIREIPAAIPVG